MSEGAPNVSETRSICDQRKHQYHPYSLNPKLCHSRQSPYVTFAFKDTYSEVVTTWVSGN